MSIDPELVSALCCVESQKPVVYVPASEVGPAVVFCPESKLAYPVDPAGFPVMLRDEASSVTADEAAALMARANA